MSDLVSIIAAPDPIEVELQPGETYYWCACGRSGNQPFCDGSHAGTGLEPKTFEMKGKKAKSVWLCRCKQTKTGPYCDGAHNHLA
jgi:CDGSH-type Zn-finger protein